jgi:hypothetical protein
MAIKSNEPSPLSLLLNHISLFLDAIFFIVYLLLSILVIVKVNYKMDKAAWITIITYIIVFLLLNVENILFWTSNIDIQDAHRFIMFLVYGLHAYFIFVMKDVYNKLTCDNQNEYMKRIKREKIIKIVILILLLMYLIAVFAKFIF